MKKNIFFFALVAYIQSINGNLNDLQTQQVDPEDPHTIHVNNNNHNNNRLDSQLNIAVIKPALNDCTSFRGAELKECMSCQSKENFRNNMKALTNEQAFAYWQSLQTPREYYEALLNYDSEDEWKEFYDSRKRAWDYKFPESLAIQKVRLKQAYINAYYHFTIDYYLPYLLRAPSQMASFTIWLAVGERAEDIDTLGEFIKKYEFEHMRGSVSHAANQALVHEFQVIIKTGLFDRR